MIQTRVDGAESFRRDWNDYKNGFGKFQSEFWLGNEYIHQITSAGLYLVDDDDGNDDSKIIK